MKNSEKTTISIRGTLITVFIVITLITVTLISFVVFRNWLKTARETTARIASDLNSEVYQQVDTFMQLPIEMEQINQKLIEQKIVDLSQENEREKFFVSVLSSKSEDIYSFSIGLENGDYYGARRNADGVIEIMRNNTETNGVSWYYAVNDDFTAGERTVIAGKFDPRTRDWYQAAQETGDVTFSPIYKHFIMEDLTVSAAIPIYQNDGQLQGVLGTHIILGNINHYLSEIVSDNMGTAVIVEKETGDLIANSLNEKNFFTIDEQFNRIDLSGLGYPVAEEGYQYYLNTQKMQFVIPVNQQNYYFNLTEYQKNGLDWLIITTIPERLLLNEFYSNLRLALILVILSVTMSLLIYYFLINRLFHPVQNLIDTTQKFTNGDFKQRAAVNRVDEIGKISIAFNQMAESLSTLVNHLDEAVKERTNELEEAKFELETSKNQLRFILDTAVEGIYGIDLDGKCTFCNKSAVKLLGFETQNEILGKNMHDLIHHSYPDGRAYPQEECAMLHGSIARENSYSDEEVFWRPDGSSFIAEYYAFPQYREKKLTGNLITFIDITERKISEEKIKFISCHDSLTGLLNRRCFEESMRLRDKKDNLPMSIIFADLNALKLTNDIFGHKAGDELIKQAAKFLSSACRATDVIGRIGGDEFMILLPNTPKDEAQKIIKRIKQQMVLDIANPIKCSLSMGCDTKIHESDNLENLMENAENNMYQEKTLQRDDVNQEMLNTLILKLYEKDPQQKEHAATVVEISQKLGFALNLNEVEINMLKKAAYFHDIGKITFPEKLIKQWFSLDKSEHNEFQQHTAVGYRLMKFFDNSQDLLDGIYYHHEKWDGSGYPKGLRAENIPLFARIIAIANHYDWLNRKNHFENKNQLFTELRTCSGKILDPKLVQFLINQLNEE